MTSPSAFLYRYTPAEVGKLRILACKSILSGRSRMERPLQANAVEHLYMLITKRKILQRVSLPDLGAINKWRRTARGYQRVGHIKIPRHRRPLLGSTPVKHGTFRIRCVISDT